MDVAERRATSWAVVLAALLHLGLIGFLWMATLPCATWERLFGSLGLPEGWNPVVCSKPLTLSGPVIEATLLGPTGAPLPPPAKKPVAKPTPPPPPRTKPKVPLEKPKLQPVKTLPPPPRQPDVKDQEKVVAEAREKAEQAKREQAERERERMSELEAQRQDAEIDKLFKEMDQAKQQSREAARQTRLQQQKLAQLKDLKKSEQPPGPPDVAEAKQAQTGTNGPDSGLLGQYQAAIQNAVTQAWLRPDNIPNGAACNIDIVQIRGGQVISAKVESDCPFDPAARRSVENAVMSAAPLPYRGFESVFQRQITLHFKVQD